MTGGRRLDFGAPVSYKLPYGTHELGKPNEKEEKMIIAQLSVYPLGEGTSLSRFVKQGIKVIQESGHRYEIGGMSTAVEVPDLDSLFSLVKRIHQAHLQAGAKRIVIDLKVDDRRDKEATLETKKGAVK
jgi:uncharacterized protein (TIGR00106 family)